MLGAFGGALGIWIVVGVCCILQGRFKAIRVRISEAISSGATRSISGLTKPSFRQASSTLIPNSSAAVTQSCSYSTYSIDAMDWGSVELEPEVRSWLEALSAEFFARAAFYIDLLVAEGVLLGEPYTKQLDGKLRELRFHLGSAAWRVTYWIAPERRIILLTVFSKTRMRETREVQRAKKALQRCVGQGHVVEEGDR